MSDDSVTDLPPPDPQKLRNSIETILGELAVGDFTIRYHETGNRDQYLTITTADPIPGVERSPVEEYDLTEDGIVPRRLPVKC